MVVIEKYSRIKESDDEVDDAMSACGDEVNDFDMEFIDDETNVQGQGPSEYGLMNVTRDLQEAMQDQSTVQELDLVSSDPENFVSDYFDEIEHEFDEFAGLEKRIQKFRQDLCHVVNDLLMSKNLFLRVYEPRKKFRYLIKNVVKGKNIIQSERSFALY